jgi:phosphatidylglycerol:prolipoprotein diacylglycerol transferase
MHWTGNPSVHQAFEIAGYVAAALVYTRQRMRRGDPLPDDKRAVALLGAALGAAVGSRLLVLFAGKTIVGGLLGGLIGVELAKKATGIRRSTGDLFVLPLIAAMVLGRIGCFLAGPIDKTAGLPTSLPWGIAIADGVKRHPVALYEIAFLLLLLPIVRRRYAVEGDSFRIFLSGYLAFRLLVDFLKPDPPRIFLGLSAIQWACLAGLGYYALAFSNAERHASLSFLRRRRVDLHDVLAED